MPAFSVLSGSPHTRSTRILAVAVFLVVVFLFLGNSQLTAGPYLGSTTDADLSPEHFANQHKQPANHGLPPADAAGLSPTHQNPGDTSDHPSTEDIDDGYDHDVAIEEPDEKGPDQDVWHDEKEDERLAAAPARTSEPEKPTTSAVLVAPSTEPSGLANSTSKAILP